MKQNIKIMPNGIKDAKILISETEDAIKNKPRDVRWRYNSRYYGREWQMRYANPPIGDVVKRELEEMNLSSLGPR